MAPSVGRVTTNELRRKVAARMRELFDENKYISLDALVVRAIGDDLPDGMGYERMLADLIDSPKTSRKRFTAEELRERRNRQHYESLVRCGHASICPECGGYTTSDNGYHIGCAKKVGIPIKRRHNA